jgi:hypothetical protein
MASTIRTALPDFGLANYLYAGATVYVYEANDDGTKSSTLATLYEDRTSSNTLDNPQELDSAGKWEVPVYVDTAVILEITNVSGVPDHDTGVFEPSVDVDDIDAATEAADFALIYSEEARKQAVRARAAAETFGADYLEKTNNLSDVPLPSDARTNLGLEIGTDVAAPNQTIITASDLFFAHNFT